MLTIILLANCAGSLKAVSSDEIEENNALFAEALKFSSVGKLGSLNDKHKDMVDALKILLAPQNKYENTSDAQDPPTKESEMELVMSIGTTI